MSSSHQDSRIQELTELFLESPHLFNHEFIPEFKSKGTSGVIATLPLNHHIIHGETVLFINETLDSNGDIEKYRYGWELSQRNGRMGKSTRHISAFDKQDHPEPPYNNIETDPYHHHYLPGNLLLRTETNVKSLKDVVNILTDYIVGQFEYNENHRF